MANIPFNPKALQGSLKGYLKGYQASLAKILQKQQGLTPPSKRNGEGGSSSAVDSFMPNVSAFNNATNNIMQARIEILWSIIGNLMSKLGLMEGSGGSSTDQTTSATSQGTAQAGSGGATVEGTIGTTFEGGVLGEEFADAFNAEAKKFGVTPLESFRTGQNIGQSTRRSASTAGKNIGQNATGNVFSPEDYKNARKNFITQHISPYNPNEDTGHTNNNCGPGCLAMAARSLGVTGLTLDTDQLIENMRVHMGEEADEMDETNIRNIAIGAEQLGLSAELKLGGATTDDVQAALNDDKKVVVNVTSPTGNHFVVVDKIKNGVALIRDPQKNDVTEISVEELNKRMNDANPSGGFMVSIGKKATA